MNIELLIGKNININRVIFINRRTGTFKCKEEEACIYKVSEPEKTELISDKRYEVYYHYKDGSAGFSKLSEYQIKEILKNLEELLNNLKKHINQTDNDTNI